MKGRGWVGAVSSKDSRQRMCNSCKRTACAGTRSTRCRRLRTSAGCGGSGRRWTRRKFSNGLGRWASGRSEHTLSLYFVPTPPPSLTHTHTHTPPQHTHTHTHTHLPAQRSLAERAIVHLRGVREFVDDLLLERLLVLLCLLQTLAHALEELSACACVRACVCARAHAYDNALDSQNSPRGPTSFRAAAPPGFGSSFPCRTLSFGLNLYWGLAASADSFSFSRFACLCVCAVDAYSGYSHKECRL